MKRFSKNLMTLLMVTMVAISLIGCATKVVPVDVAPVAPPAPAAEEIPAAPAEEPAPAPVVEEVPAEEAAEAPVVEEVVEAEPEAVEEAVVETVVEEAKPVELPYGIDYIVKNADGQDTFDLIVVHTNDVHGRVEGTDKNIGYGRLATMLNVGRDITDNILVLDAGDTMHGTNVVNLFQGETVGVLLEMCGYDAIAPGNHDFNYGKEALFDAAELADEYGIKVLSANILDENGYLCFDPAAVYDFNGFKVGVVGLTTPDTAFKTHPKNVEGLSFMDERVVKYAQYAIDEFRNYVDFVLVLGHVGNDEDSVITSKFICDNLDGIDLFVDGHSHDAGVIYSEKGTPIVQAGEYMEELGVVDIYVKDGKLEGIYPMTIEASDVTDCENSPLAQAFGIVNVPKDPQVEAYIEYQNGRMDEILEEVVGYIPYPLNGERADVRTKQTNLSKIVCAAMTEASGADFTITNGGGIRASIPAGEIRIADIVNSLPFTNIVTTVEMTGADVYAAMEHGYRALPDTNGGYAQTDLKVVYNKFGKPLSRIMRLTTPSGKVIDRNDTTTVYHVATNDFMAAGGDGYTMFGKVVREGSLLSDAVIDYVRVHYPVAD